MLIRATFAALLLFGIPAVQVESSDPPPVSCTGRVACQVTATGGGAPGTGGNGSLAGSQSGGGPDVVPDCWEQPLAEQPGVDSPYWRGNNASQGEVVRQQCQAGSGVNPQVIVPYFRPFGDPAAAAPPPPSPEVLAQQAIAEMHIPMPTISIGPDRAKAAVNLWTWLWVDEAPPVSVTVSAGGVSVTATATMTSTTWTLGEPAPTGGPYAAGPAVTHTCTGTGSRPPVNYDWRAEPPCGHRFTWMSTAERTGAGAWPITVTANWAVTWQSNTGAAGTDSLTGTAADALPVGEYRTVLVRGPGG